MQAQAVSFIETALSALERSVRERRGEFRNIQLATLSPEGRPRVRTVVLRVFDRASATAELHTDARAEKARDIAQASDVSFLAWSPDDHLQLRFDGSARLHRADGVARARWDGLPSKGRVAFGLRAAAGTPIADPEDRSHLPEQEQYQQFSVVLISLTRVDVLRLEPEGAQTRAVARLAPAIAEATWVGP